MALQVSDRQLRVVGLYPQQLHRDCMPHAGKGQASQQAKAQPQPQTKEDAVLRHLLRSIRSDTVRRQFLTIPRKEYSTVKDVRVMVSAAAQTPTLANSRNLTDAIWTHDLVVVVWSSQMEPL
jgi:hypothetical protein